MANKRKDISGNRYGKLVALHPTKPNHKGLWGWLFQCDCGQTVERSIVFVSKIKPGVVSSCGCECHLITHGLSYSTQKLNWVWSAMRQRCTNPNNKDYINYGARGITICDEWDDYAEFVKWATASGYKDKVTIERVDVNGNYCPENCTWVANELQALNTTRNVYYEYKGGSYSIRQLSEIAGVNYNTMRGRITNYGWSVERAMGDIK